MIRQCNKRNFLVTLTMKHYLILTYLTSSSCHQVDLEAKILNIGFNLPHPPIYGNPGQYANPGARNERILSTGPPWLARIGLLDLEKSGPLYLDSCFYETVRNFQILFFSSFSKLGAFPLCFIHLCTGLGTLGSRDFPDQPIKLKQLLCWKQSILGSVVPLAMFYFFRPTLNTRCLAQMLRCLSLLTHLYYYASNVDILRSADISTFSFGPSIDCIGIVSSPLSLIIRNRDILLSSKRNTFANRCWVFFHFVTDKLLANFATFLQIVVWISHPWSIGPYWPGTTKY